MLSKEDFVSYINEIQNVYDFDKEVANVAIKHKLEFFEINYSELGYLCAELLDKLMCGNSDITDDVSYFCFELNFGKDWKPGSVIDKDENGNEVEVDFSTAEKLYDYLAARYNEGR